MKSKFCKCFSEAPNGYVFYMNLKLSRYFKIDKITNLKDLVKVVIRLEDITSVNTAGNSKLTVLLLKSGHEAYHNDYLTGFLKLFPWSFVKIRTEIAIPLWDVRGFSNNEDLVYFNNMDEERVSKHYLPLFKKRVKAHFSTIHAV